MSLMRGLRIGPASLLAAAGLLAVAAASPATAASSAPVQRAAVTCVQPSSALEFGGAVVELKLKNSALPKTNFLVVVPVDNATGLESGDRITIERRSSNRATLVIPADGSSLTPASTIEVRRGGTVVQRVAVRGGCGVLNPTPNAGPIIGAISSSGGTVTVPITNGSSVNDDIGVTLFPIGGNVGDTRFVSLAPGASGTVTFSNVAAGQYTVEAFGYHSFKGSESAPFAVS